MKKYTRFEVLNLPDIGWYSSEDVDILKKLINHYQDAYALPIDNNSQNVKHMLDSISKFLKDTDS